MSRVVVIGSGFAGLTSAISLAHEGYDVTVLEKNDSLGGRARRLKIEDFTFDMGPSWYWMPDVFDNFFRKFGKSTSDYYQLDRLDPSYRVYFGKDDLMDVPADVNELAVQLEQMETGAGSALMEFLDQAAYKYEVGINDLVYKPGRSLLEFADMRVVKGVFKMDLFQSISKHLRRFFKNKRIIQLLEFPVLFLGALPEKTPALYSLMNYADLKLGTWYPKGGMHKIIEGLVALAAEKGVRFELNQNVIKIDVEGDTAHRVVTTSESFDADIVVGGADYHHIDQKLLEPAYRRYSQEYWEKREMAPSSLIFYLGINKKLKNLHHHNLFFDEDFKVHAQEIYEDPKWPTNPLFYVSVTSQSDPSVAPKGCENVFILIPIAPGLKESEGLREKYYEVVMDRMERITGQSIRDHVVVKKSYGVDDFKRDYHAFKGNAYGLANTLRQTAILKPSMKSKKVKNLYYTGQLTVPGPGVPPSIISGQVVAEEIKKEYPLALTTQLA